MKKQSTKGAVVYGNMIKPSHYYFLFFKGSIKEKTIDIIVNLSPKIRLFFMLALLKRFSIVVILKMSQNLE